jgi:predicted peptidase
MIKLLSPVLLALALAGCATERTALSEPQLIRVPYHSAKMNAERDYFVYLPRGFAQQDKWPVILFLHGNGERGDGKADLDYLLKHGPLMEAWCQKRDLPFVIISPQLPMYDQGDVPYIKNRTLAEIPKRVDSGPNPYYAHYAGHEPMQGQLAEEFPAKWADLGQSPRDWNTIEDEVLSMLDRVLAEDRGDPKRVYLTGLSLGGVGTWNLAAKHPERFAAIAPIGSPAAVSLAPALARAKMPVWLFYGGRDPTLKYCYPLLNKLEELGDTDVRFTIEADMAHNAWIRAYAGQDLYSWFLSHSK